MKQCAFLILIFILAFPNWTIAQGEKQSKMKLDKSEYAPGYPEYTVQATDQLKQFPLPRFGKKFLLHKNFPWTDINYLHRELPGNGGMGFGRVSPEIAISLTDELARNWNYYIDLPCLRFDSLKDLQIYRDENSVEHSLIKYANSHPEFPTSTIIYHLQINGSHLGFPVKNYVTSQSLEAKYYLRDETGNPIIANGKKWLSPEMPLDIVVKDALVSRMYLRQLLKELTRPLNFINENGEVFGHMRPDSLFRKDPRVAKEILKSKLTNPQFNGRFQYKMDSAYKATILAEPKLNGAKFSFYNVSSVQNAYWPDYAMRRESNSWFNGQHYSTPAFYPRTPDNWAVARGPWNGYGIIADGRRREIALGDKFFSPFVCAGWGLEENNIRPAQWLGLLKAMCMLGADFFYVGYFNVTGGSGWPNGVGPNDPRGYIYQMAMPAYAQAIANKYFEFIDRGELLNPRTEAEWMYVNRYYSKKVDKDQLILVRRLGKKYLIYGSLQANSNNIELRPQNSFADVTIDGRRFQFEIRRQGSTYILDLNNKTKPIFIQLDSWHEASHPFFWSRNYMQEAEIFDSTNGTVNVSTDRVDTSLNFTEFRTYVNLEEKKSLIRYDLELRKDRVYTVHLCAKSQKGGNSLNVLKIHLNGKTYELKIDGSNKWKDYEITDDKGKAVKIVTNEISSIWLDVELEQGGVSIDNFLLKSID